MNSSLPCELYTGQQIKLGEQQAAKLAGVEMYHLMQQAGAAVFEVIKQCYPQAKHLLVFAGTGNNGGDGFVVARLAREQGMQATVCVYGDESKIVGDAERAKQEWLSIGGVITDLEQLKWAELTADVVVDGLLGTGLSGEVREPLQILFNKINASGLPLVAIDTPSGLCTDSGRILGKALVAQHTVTFIGMKQGLVTGQARAVTGALHFAGLGIDSTFSQCNEPSSYLLEQDQLVLPRRLATAHKGNHGRLLCLGGNQGYAGAIRLCASASARCGAGLIRVLCHPSSVTALQVACPEIMTLAWQQGVAQVEQAIEANDVIALGPGLGLDEWGQSLYQVLKESDKLKVVDADGLNLLAKQPEADPQRIITPHPGEAARLLHCTTKQIEQDRFQAIRDLHHLYGGVIVLKGAGTLIFDGDYIHVCPAGNPGMATGGMGDVLTGIIAALLAQGLSLSEAAKLGVMLHSVAADQLAESEGEIGLLASDVITQARKVLNDWLR